MEKTIKISKDIPIDQILKEYEYEIFNSALDSMSKNYKNFDIEEINVINIQTESIDYNISLTRSKFKLWLNKCMSFFETLEEYEKCQICVNILSYLDQNNKKIK